MLTLINREFWEQRGAFFNVPMILASIFALVSVILLILFFGKDINIQSGVINQEVTGLIPAAFASIASPFVLILWFIVFYYFLGSLYDDRKDGSILFWQSMPVSQTETIISKLFAGLILAPFCTWIAIMITQLFILCIASIFFMIHPIVRWTMLWNIPAILLTWLRIFATILLQALWLLPLFAWCMLCSAFAKKAPALRALVPVTILIILEVFLFSKHYFTDFLYTRFQYAIQAWHALSANTIQLISNQGQISVVKQIGLSMQSADIKFLTMGIGVAISLFCYVLAGWFRSRCYDFEK